MNAKSEVRSTKFEITNPMWETAFRGASVGPLTRLEDSPTSPPSKHGGEVGLSGLLLKATGWLEFQRSCCAPTSPPCFDGGEVATSLRVAGEGEPPFHQTRCFIGGGHR